jgi:hypothetical protein
LLFGRNSKQGANSGAWALEADLSGPKISYFGRLESVQKDELQGVPAGDYRIGKLILGSVATIARKDGAEWGLGAYVGLYDFPSSLKPFYGSSPRTLGVFLRIRPERMH